MQIRICDSAEAPKEAAALIASQCRDEIGARSRAVLAVSGGRTPWQMLEALIKEDISWPQMHVVQVDERIAPAGDPDRNLTQLQSILVARGPLPPDQLYAMPVEETDLDQAAQAYCQTLERLAGTPAVLDVVHLGLGADGHTASLVPGDRVLEVTDADVAVTAKPYQGRRRVTLTYPILSRARSIVWLVTGAEKADMLARLVARDPSIPAGRVNQEYATLVADAAVAARLTIKPGRIDH